MKTYTTDTGIKLLLPVVPKGAYNIDYSAGKKYEYPYSQLFYSLGGFRHNVVIDSFNGDGTILGTCWRENGKLVCEGFDPASLLGIKKAAFIGGAYMGFTFEQRALYNFDSWVRREGIEIAEGEFMNVVLKVN